MEREKILEINNMKISFTQYQKGIQQTELPVIKDLSVTIHAGEMVAVVGSSGSGKSLLAHGIMGILPYNAEMGGEIRYCGSRCGTMCFIAIYKLLFPSFLAVFI